MTEVAIIAIIVILAAIVIGKANHSNDLVCFNQIAMAEVTEQDITGQESLLSECLTWAPVMNVLPLNSLNYIMEHIIFDDS